MQLCEKFGVFFYILIMLNFHPPKILKERLEDIILLLVGKFGKTVGSKRVPFGEVKGFVI
jgi:predicted Kef-type K+ transport protein